MDGATMDGTAMDHDDMDHDDMMHEDMDWDMHDGHREREEMDWENVDMDDLDERAAKSILMGEVNPMMGNLTFLMTAWGAVLGTAINAFRYRQPEDLYCIVGGTIEKGVGNTNLCTARQIYYYGNLGVWGALAITQTLSTLGIAAELNLTAWMYGHLILGLVMLAEHVLLLMSYDAAHKKCEDANDANQAFACATLGYMKHDYFKAMASGVAMELELYM